MNINEGMAEQALGITGIGPSDPLAPLRLIAAHQSTDPVLANVEQAVRDALAKHDATSRADYPPSDRFEVERYRGGDVDVKGSHAEVGTVDGTDGDEVLITAQTDIGWRDLRVSRETAIEIRDLLDVLVIETRRNTPK